MTTVYPGAVDSLPRPGAATYMDDSGFEGDVVIDNISDAIQAIETKLGTGGAAPPGSAAVLRRTGTGASAWGQIALGDLAAGAVDSAAIVDGTIVSGDIAASAISQVGIKTAAASLTTTATSFVTMPDDSAGEMAVSLTTVGGNSILLALFTGVASNQLATGVNALGFRLDAADTVDLLAFTAGAVSAYGGHTVSFTWTGVSAGAHTVRVRWRVSTGTFNVFGRVLTVLELKK